MLDHITYFVPLPRFVNAPSSAHSNSSSGRGSSLQDQINRFDRDREELNQRLHQQGRQQHLQQEEQHQQQGRHPHQGQHQQQERHQQEGRHPQQLQQGQHPQQGRHPQHGRQQQRDVSHQHSSQSGFGGNQREKWQGSPGGHRNERREEQ